MSESKRTTRTERKRGKSFLQRTLLVLVGLVIGAAIVEGACRFIWKAPWYDQLLAEQRRLQEYDYTGNSLNFRDRDYAAVKPKGVKRVLLLGDSFTYGLGVPEDEDIFADIIEQRLNEMQLPSAPNGVEVLNAGFPKTLTGHWVTFMETLAPQFQPDVVVIVFFLRDGTEIMLIPEYFMKIRADIVARNADSFWYHHSYAWRLVRDNFDRRVVSDQYTQRFLDAYLGNELETREWRTAERNLVHIRDVAEKYGARTGLVIFPILVQLDDNYPFTPICELLSDFAEVNHMPSLDLLDTFRGHNAADIWVSPWDQHPNAEGHQLVADALTPFVVELLGESE